MGGSFVVIVEQFVIREFQLIVIIIIQFQFFKFIVRIKLFVIFLQLYFIKLQFQFFEQFIVEP
jgi:hypothetical protein